jgi:hypothetical protein
MKEAARFIKCAATLVIRCGQNPLLKDFRINEQACFCSPPQGLSDEGLLALMASLGVSLQ